MTYKGVKMLSLNGKGLPEAEYIAALEETKQELLRDRTSPPVIIELSRTSMTAATTAKSKELATATKEAGLPDGPCAVVGLSKLAKAVAQLFGRDAHYFDTVDEAEEWLIKEWSKTR